MKIACLCPTFNRPGPLAESIACFLRQSYPAEKRELVILDDAGQYAPEACDGLPGVKLITTGHRFRTLGEKRNATAALASPDVEAYAVWDDDDIYLPWHLEQLAGHLAGGARLVRPPFVWTFGGGQLRRKATGGLFHGAWGFTREAFLSVAGYPAMQSGQDQGLLRRLRAAGVPTTAPDERPSYIYFWHARPEARHLSALGQGGYERRGEEPIAHVDKLTPEWSKDWAAMVAKA